MTAEKIAGEFPVGITFRRLPWVRITLRKDARCWESGELIQCGSKAWRPLGNGKNRMRRLSDETVRAILENDNAK